MVEKSFPHLVKLNDIGIISKFTVKVVFFLQEIQKLSNVLIKKKKRNIAIHLKPFKIIFPERKNLVPKFSVTNPQSTEDGKNKGVNEMTYK